MRGPSDARPYMGDLLDVPQEDLLIARDGGGAVVFYQLVQGAELHHPQEVLSSTVAEDLEVLDVIPVPGPRHREENREDTRKQSSHGKECKHKVFRETHDFQLMQTE